ncbi:MAG: DUF1858 domain-containing protein [Candidatus Nealsonbacteria bacterium]
MKKITKEMTIAQVVESFPQTTPVLMGLGLHCAGCPAAQSETIEDLAKSNQMNLDEFLENLNNTTKS